MANTPSGRRESLSEVARKYHTATAAISEANSLNFDYRIQIGEKLIIPVAPGRADRAAQVGSGTRIRYTVRRGDTVTSISRDFDVPVAQIRKWNRLKPKTPLRPGRVLVFYTVPGGVAPASYPGAAEKTGIERKGLADGSKQVKLVHKVKKGETLYAIAANYRTTIESIRTWNNLSEQANLKVGDYLTIYVDR